MATSFYHHPPHHRPQTMHGLNVSSSQSDPRSLPSPGSALPPIRSIIPDFDKLDMDYGRRQSQAHKDTIDGGHSQGYTTDRLPTTGSSPSIPVFSQHSHGQQDSGARTHLDGPLPRLPPSDAFAQHNGYHQNSEPRRGYPQYGQHQPIYRQDSYPPHGYPQDSYYPPLEHRHGPFPQPGSQQNFYEQRARSERLHYAHPWGGHSDSAVSPRGGDGGKNKRRGNLPKEVTEKLYAWLYGHLNHPYPTEDEKQKMMRETNMQMSKINRERLLQKHHFTDCWLFRSNFELVHQRPSPQSPPPHRTGKGRDRGREALSSQLVTHRPPNSTGFGFPHETLQPLGSRPWRAQPPQRQCRAVN